MICTRCDLITVETHCLIASKYGHFYQMRVLETKSAFWRLQSAGTWPVSTAGPAQVPWRERWQLQLICYY